MEEPTPPPTPAIKFTEPPRVKRLPLPYHMKMNLVFPYKTKDRRINDFRVPKRFRMNWYVLEPLIRPVRGFYEC